MTVSTALHPAERDLLQEAFQTFDQAAQTLQHSYLTLTQRIEEMDLELSQSNDALRTQLCENEAMRLHLSGILDSLTTGVLVVVPSTTSGQNITPSFSPDGQKLIFSRMTEQSANLNAVSATDLCCLERLTATRFCDFCDAT